MKQLLQPKYANLMLIRLFQYTFGPGILLTSLAMFWAFWGAPEDSLQTSTSRILYVHVPAAWMSLFCFAGLGLCSLLALVWRIPLFSLSTLSLARLSAMFSALTLITGMLWAKPMWGAWWVWDARLTAMFLQFIMTLGIISLHPPFNIGEPQKRGAHIFALMGLVNLPIIKGSVIWWNTLHQGPTFTLNQSHMDGSMTFALMFVFAGYFCLALAIVSLDIRATLLQQRIYTLMYRRSHAA